MTLIYYFAFGSNLLRQRIQLRNPSAKYLGIGCLMDHLLTFGGQSASWCGATATIVPSKSDRVYGVVWSISDDQIHLLDEQEGAPTLYHPSEVPVVLSTSGITETYPEMRRETRRVNLGSIQCEFIRIVSSALQLPVAVARRSLLIDTCLETVDGFIHSEKAFACLAVYPQRNKVKKTVIERVVYCKPEEAYGIESAMFIIKCGSNQPLTMENFSEYIHYFKLYNDQKYFKPLRDLIRKLFLPMIQEQQVHLGKLDPVDKGRFIHDVEDYLACLDGSITCFQDTVHLTPCLEINFDNVSENARYTELAQNLSTLGTVEECACRWMQQISLKLRALQLVREETDADGPHAEVTFWKQRMSRLNSIMDQLSKHSIIAVTMILKAAKSKTLDIWLDLEKQIVSAYHEAKENAKFLQSVEKHCLPLHRGQINEMKSSVSNLMHVLRMIFAYSTHYRSSTHMTVLFKRITNQMIKGCITYLTEHGMKSIWDQPYEIMMGKLNECLSLNESYQAAYHNLYDDEAQTNEATTRFHFSRLQLFGDFDEFAARLQALKFVLENLSTYSVVKEFPVEDKQPLLDQLRKLKADITSKSTNCLSIGNQRFTNDLINFTDGIHSLEQRIEVMLNQYVQQGGTVQMNLQRLLKIDKVNPSSSGHLSRYKRLFATFRSEMEDLSLAYMHQCEKPPIDWNMPPFSGRIAWARRYYLRLSQPMSLFWNRVPELRDTKECFKAVGRYNRLGEALVSYEILAYRNWKGQIKHGIQGIEAPLLVVLKENNKFREVINLDPAIMALFRETVCMDRFSCPIPQVAREMFLRSKFIKMRKNKLQDMMSRVNAVMKRLTPELERMLIVRLYTFYQLYYRGFYEHDWYSSLVDRWIEDVEREIDLLDNVLTQSTDILQSQINKVIDEIANYTLIEFPEAPDTREADHAPISECDITMNADRRGVGGFHPGAGRTSTLYRSPWKSTAWDVYDLVRTIYRRTLQNAIEIQTLSRSIEEAANRYINMMSGDFYAQLHRNEKPATADFSMNEDAEENLFDNQLPHSENRPTRIPFSTFQGSSEESRRQRLTTKVCCTIEDQLRCFGQRTLDAVIKAVRSSLEEIWRHFGMRDVNSLLKDVPVGRRVNAGSIKPHPIVKCEVSLVEGKLVLRPPLEEIQTAIRAINGCLLTCTKMIGKWNESGQRSKHIFGPGIRSLVARFPSAQIQNAKSEMGNPMENKKDPSLYERSSIVLMQSATTFLNSGQRKLSQATVETPTRDSDDQSSRSRRESGGKKGSNDLGEMVEIEVNCYQDIRHDREIYRAQSMLVTWQNTMKKVLFLTRGLVKEVRCVTEPLEMFSFLWETTPEKNLAAFMADYRKPTVTEFDSKFQECKEFEVKLDNLYAFYIVGPLELHTELFQSAALQLLNEHKHIFVLKCVELFIHQIQPMANTIEEYDRIISHPIVNLDDIFHSIDTMRKIHSREVSMDMALLQAEDIQTMLQRYDLALPQEQADRIEATRWALTRLIDRSASAMDRLLEIQHTFREELLETGKEVRQLIQQFTADYFEHGPITPGLTQYEAFDRQLIFRCNHEQLMRKAESCSRGEGLFGLNQIQLDGMRRIGQQLELLQRLYSLFSDVNRTNELYAYMSWQEADMTKLQDKLTELLNECHNLPKALKHWPAYYELSSILTDMVSKLPLLNMLRNSAMKSRHWQRIEQLVDMNYLDPEATDVTVGTMLKLPIAPSDGALCELVEEVCIGAAREKDIQICLNTVIAEWSQAELNLAPFKNRGNLLLHADTVQETIHHLEESMLTLASLSNNRYNVPFRTIIQHWVHSLSTTCELLELWLHVQSLWAYLEAVFVVSDLVKQLPQAAKNFHNIDRNWMRLMERASDTPNVVAFCTADASLQELLPRMLGQLEQCQRSLSNYLESKRHLFPRFYFVSDSVLLEILGQATAPRAVQKHLLTIFDNTKYMTYESDSLFERIVAVYSSEDVELQLTTSVICQGPVENWLSHLLQSIQLAVHELIQAGYTAICDDDYQLLVLLNSYPAQVGLLVLQFIWTKEASQSLDDVRYDPRSMQSANKHFQHILLQLIEQTTLDLSSTERNKYETFITIHLHQKDIFEELCKMGIRSSADFDWTKQTRAEFREELDMCVISITDVKFKYQNEFLGCTERLVITPLTDRCYVTLAQALNLGFGGLPTGPAGTGKTETVKDMGRCLGQYVVRFNCSAQMDFHGLGRIFKGLAQSGAWGCFDEFNRLDLPVLSVAGQQIAIVLQAKRESKSTFVFTDGETVSLNSEFAIFITTNPGYAGRQKLPENLKSNFRQVAMMVPDRQIIIRVKLAACGYVNNVVLARKFHCLNQLCQEQLTKQVHYDFGLRNVLCILRTLGANRRLRRDEPEEQIVMRVLRDMNLSKLVDQDEPLFLSLLNDLFPGQTADKGDSDLSLVEQITKETIRADLIPHDPWLIKVLNIYDVQRVRHGVMVLGPSGTGKSKSISILQAARTECDQPHREVRMNPKAITTAEMFGFVNEASRDWTDGIFTALWRRTLRLKPNEHCWLILDGPVDTIWIENLNSVLDDNKTLTLANGDRIAMVPNCKVVFEVDCVENASPATISRNGMVYLSSASLPWLPIFQSWLQRRTEFIRSAVGPQVESLFPRLLKFVQLELSPHLTYLEAFHMHQFCDLFDGMVDEQVKDEDRLINITIFCCIWSCGCLLELDERSKLDNFLRKICSIVDLPNEMDGLTMFDYQINPQGEWIPWADCVETFIEEANIIPTSNEFRFIFIPNAFSVLTQFLLCTIGKQRKAILLVGESGTGKTIMIHKYLDYLKAEGQLSKVYSFSSSTTPALFQRGLGSFVERRVGSTYGPPGGKMLTVFIDDINMPVINEWGNQVANELVRQVMESGGVYSLDKAGEFLTLMDLQFVAAMATPGGGRSDIPTRLKRQFNVFNTTLTSTASIDHIFRTIVSRFICDECGFSSEVTSLALQLVPLTREVWGRTKQHMLPTPAKFHYKFNLRDLTRIWKGIVGVSSEVFTGKDKFVMLWQHEVHRVLCDRLMCAEERLWFDGMLVRLAQQHLGKQLMEHVSREVFLVNFMNEPEDSTNQLGLFVAPEGLECPIQKAYEPITDIIALRERIIRFQEQINESMSGNPIELVFFTDAIRHLVRTTRAIQNASGHIVLIGATGCGKRSIARLSAKIAGYEIFECPGSCENQFQNFIDDLKRIHRFAGDRNIGSVIIFADDRVRDDMCYDYVNQILTTGFVPNLFQRDEFEELLIPFDEFPASRHSRTMISYEGLFDLYQARVRSNLHIVLCFSPIGTNFRQRLLNYPGISSGCVLNWIDDWPDDALLSVARQYLLQFHPMDESYVKAVVNIHRSVTNACTEYSIVQGRTIPVTPYMFFTFMEGVKQLYEELSTQLNAQLQKMETGVEKLNEAQLSIDDLRTVLAHKEFELHEATEQAETVLCLVTEQAAIAEQARNRVLQVKERCETIVQSIMVDRIKAKQQLDAAGPTLREAEEALNTLKPNDITTLRKLQKPPHLIMRIMDCVMIMSYTHLDTVKPDPDRRTFASSWNEALKVLFNANFINVLLTYPKHRMNEELIDLLEPYTTTPDYTVAMAKKVCGSVAGLLQWTLSMIRYYWVSRTVIPLQDKLLGLEQKLKKANNNLISVKNVLTDKTKSLLERQAEYEAAITKKMRVQDEAKVCRHRMSVAHKLIEELAFELIRWTGKSIQIRKEIDELGGDVVQLTAFLTYAGAFNQRYRSRLLSNWQVEVIRQNLPHRHKLEVADLFVDQAVLNDWSLHGLPMDDISIQNAIIATKSHRYPLLIDPQAQGKDWLCSLYSKTIIITSFDDRNFQTQLEHALDFGLPILLENMTEEMNVTLDALIHLNFIQTRGIRRIRLNDKEIVVAPNFKLFLTTHLANPLFPAKLCTRTTLIDFSTTLKGLEDQLLARVIDVEREKIERSRIELLANVANNKRQMARLEDNLLQRLVSCKCSLVDDMNLISVLRDTKNTVQIVAKQLSQAAEAELDIEQAREEYRTVATRGSLIYFLMADFSTVNRMYQYGLPQFIKLFNESLTQSERSSITQRRIGKMKKHMTFSIWEFVMQSLFKKDRLMFTLLLAIRISLQSGQIRQDELDILTTAGSAYTMNDCPMKPHRWIPDSVWLNLKALSKLQQFADVMNHVVQHERQWRQWYDKESPEELPIPGPYETDSRPLTHLLLVRCWSMDRFVTETKRFISSTLGLEFVEDVLLETERLYHQATRWNPIVNFLSTGTDPTVIIEQLARRKRIPLTTVAMGQGQDFHAKHAVNQALVEGSWVLLQNCHLSPDYIQELYTVIIEAAPKFSNASRQCMRAFSGASNDATEYSQASGTITNTLSMTNTLLTSNSATPTESVQDKFRLWITTEVHEKFPVNFLQISIKFTNQTPEGIKSSLLRTYSDITQDFLDACVSAEWKAMLYALAYLHCTVQERRKFGYLGWAIPYEFTQADFNASVQFMQNHVDQVEFTKRSVKHSGIDWKCIRYMIAETQYGGRISDDCDLRLLNTITKTFFQERMFYPDFQLATNYRIPRLSTLSQVKAFILSLPARDSPEAFHLHPNADIDYATRTGNYIIDFIKVIKPKECPNALPERATDDKHSPIINATNRESTATSLCEDILSKLPAPIAPYRLWERLETIGILRPMNIFLRLEMEQMNKLLHLVSSTLNDVLMAIRGQVVMNQSLREVMETISDVKVPLTWIKLSWESNALGLWFTELLDRCTQLFSWLLESCPISFWMSGFFNPQGFLTALRQEITRSQSGWTLDSVVLVNRVTRLHLEDIRERPAEGAYVHGMYLQGAAWDNRNGRMVEARPKQLYDLLPVIHLSAQLEISPGMYVGGFSTLETQPNKYVYRPLKAKRTFTIPGKSSKLVGDHMRRGANISLTELNIGDKHHTKARETNRSGETQADSSYPDCDGKTRIYIAPVYEKWTRTTEDCITTLKLPCSKHSDHWIMRGVAILGDFR